MRKITLPLFMLLTGCILLAAAGCGGGGDAHRAANTGNFSIAVVFPPLQEAEVRPAVIYTGTQSITVDILDQTTKQNVVPQKTLNSPSPLGGKVNATITPVPVGTWLLLVQGWEEQNGGGKLLSKVTDTVTINVGQTTTKTVTMDGYPFEITLFATPNPVLVDETTEIIATPKAINGDTLLGNFEYEWGSSNDGIAKVKTPGGTAAGEEFIGVSRGTCTVSATLQHDDPDAGRPNVEGTLGLNVLPNVDEVIVEPSTMSLGSGESEDATATARYKGVVVTGVTFSFSSDKTSVATVASTSANTCQVNGIAGGTATITATQPYTAASGTIAVTVPEGELDLIIQSVGGKRSRR